jgi:hypothetical protein
MANAISNIIISGVDKTQAAFRSVNSNLKTMKERATSVNSIFARFAPLIGAASITAFGQNIVDTADHLNDLKKITGVNVAELAVFDLATKQSGTSLDALAKGMAKGSRSIVDNADDLKKLGITAKTSKELIFQLADIISALPEDDPRRVAIAMQFLGRSAGELVPLLAEGGDELRRMAEEGAEAAKAMEKLAPEADAFNDNQARLQQNATLAGAKTFLPLIRYVNGYAEAGAEANGVTEVLWNNLKFAANTATGIAFLFSLFDDGAEQVEKAAKATEEQANQTKALRIQLGLLEKQLEEQKQTFAKDQKSIVADAYKQNITSLEKQIDGFKDLGKSMVEVFRDAGKAAEDALKQSKAFLQSAADIRLKGQDKIRLLDQKGADPQEVDRANKILIDEALNKADSAKKQADFQRLQGNTEEASRLLELSEKQGQRAADLADELNDEGLKRQQILASTEALAQVEESRAQVQQKIAEQEKSRQDALQEQMQKNNDAITDLEGRLQQLKDKVDEITNAGANIKIAADEEAINNTLAEIAKVQQQLDELKKGATIPLRPVNAANAQNFTGAYDSSGNAVYRDSAPVFSLAGGGPISGPGTATSDSIFARLSNGEYVIKAAAVQKYGLGFMHALNNMHLPKFANGGAVARALIPSMPRLANPGGAAGDTINLTIPGLGKYAVSASRDTSRKLVSDFSRAALMHGGLKGS